MGGEVIRGSQRVRELHVIIKDLLDVVYHSRKNTPLDLAARRLLPAPMTEPAGRRVPWGRGGSGREDPTRPLL